MPKRSIESHRKVTTHQHKFSHFNPHSHRQHGFPNLLLDLPQESLTHVTSYLFPPSLFALACTCRYLCEHVDNDNTWLRAFLNQFLGIGPEHEFEDEHILLLRRIENTWRKEFIFHYDIRGRWERSRNPTVAHSPQVSSIDEVHLMSEYGLLTSSIRYGIVARSIPLNGKVLKGYIDASGTGLGIGNPNVEFTPNVSACAMFSDGHTARVFWGKRNGEVALTVVNRVMGPRASATFHRCSVDEQHEGIVQQLIPDLNTNTLLSAGADGRIKMWEIRTLQLLWSTDKQQTSLVADPFISIAGSLGDGFVAGALKSGDIVVYGLHDSETPAEVPHVCSMHQLRISPLVHNETSLPTTRDDESSPQQVGKMWLYRTGEMGVLLFVQYTHHPRFYRVRADIQSQDVTITSFGDSSFSNVSALEPVISTHSPDSNMLVVGDLLGFVSIYNADAPLQTPVAPVHRFEAHTDGAVTAIAWSPAVFATGSARGTTVVWDSLTLEPVRYFTTPAPRPASGHDWDVVSRILIDENMVIIVVGNRVMSWRVRRDNFRGHWLGRGKHANAKMSITTKGHQQYEMNKDISESYRELEYERAHTQRTYGREREQMSTLDTLGLSELEAVQYVLMLSRDEEEARQRTVIEEGVFEGDFDDLPNMVSSSRSMSNPSTSYHSSRNDYPNGRQYPRVTLPVSNERAQVSPPFVPESMEAGESISPLRSLPAGPSASPSPMTMRSTSSSSLDHFPAMISSSTSSTPSSRRGTSASPEQPRSAWSTPLKSVSPSSPGPSSPSSRVVTPARSSNVVSPLSVNIAQHRQVSQAAVSEAEEMDDDLRLAIELSLAEARSRGENV